jgi:hypothetical protein
MSWCRTRNLEWVVGHGLLTPILQDRDFVSREWLSCWTSGSDCPRTSFRGNWHFTAMTQRGLQKVFSMSFSATDDCYFHGRNVKSLILRFTSNNKLWLLSSWSLEFIDRIFSVSLQQMPELLSYPKSYPVDFSQISVGSFRTLRKLLRNKTEENFSYHYPWYASALLPATTSFSFEIKMHQK